MLWVVAAVLLVPDAVRAQVGHWPESSPYHDLRAKQILSLSAGYLRGGAGAAGVGPTDGLLGGVRFDIHLGGPVAANLGVSYAYLDRLLIDPRQAPDTRVLGNAMQSLLIAEAGVNLVLTGPKTWHKLAPYVGVSLGLALGGDVPEDTLSGFTFSTKFQLGPQIGVRWYATDRVSLRIEARDILWRLSYPQVFFGTGTLSDPGPTPVLDPLVHGEAEWTHHPTVFLGLGYAIRF